MHQTAYPNTTVATEAAIPAREERTRIVNRLLDQVRGYVRADGGELTLIDVSDEGEVIVELSGACHGCGGVSGTIQQVIAPVLQGQLPWVRLVSPSTMEVGSAPALMGDATGALLADHALLRSLLAQVGESGLARAEVGEAYARFVSELRLHIQTEEQCLFPVIDMFLPSLVAHCERTSQACADLLGAAEAGKDGTPAASHAEMTAQLDAMLLREETMLYDAVNDTLSDDLKGELARDVAAWRRRTLRPFERHVTD